MVFPVSKSHTRRVLSHEAETARRASSNATPVDRWLGDYGLVATLLLVALMGLGLNLTPCVYPLISVTIAYFGGQARARLVFTR